MIGSPFDNPVFVVGEEREHSLSDRTFCCTKRFVFWVECLFLMFLVDMTSLLITLKYKKMSSQKDHP